MFFFFIFLCLRNCDESTKVFIAFPISNCPVAYQWNKKTLKTDTLVYSYIMLHFNFVNNSNVQYFTAFTFVFLSPRNKDCQFSSPSSIIHVQYNTYVVDVGNRTGYCFIPTTNELHIPSFELQQRIQTLVPVSAFQNVRLNHPKNFH